MAVGILVGFTNRQPTNMLLIPLHNVEVRMGVMYSSEEDLERTRRITLFLHTLISCNPSHQENVISHVDNGSLMTRR